MLLPDKDVRFRTACPRKLRSSAGHETPCSTTQTLRPRWASS